MRIVTGFFWISTGKMSVRDRERFLYLVQDKGNEVTFTRNVDDLVNNYSRKDAYTIAKLHGKEVIEQLPPGEFIIIGSGALAIFGMKCENKDIDLIVSDALYNTIKKDDRFTEEPGGKLRSEELRVDVYNGVKENGISIKKLATENHIEVDGVKVISPSALRTLYQSQTRTKDREKIEFLDAIIPDLSAIRPLTWVELFYMATWHAIRDKHCTATRYPILLIENIQLYKIHLISTQPGRTVTVRWLTSRDDATTLTLPEYPCLDKIVRTAMSVHPATLGKYDGDHDGDVLGLNILMSEESNKEVAEFLDAPSSMVDVDGRLIYGLNDSRLCKYSLYSTSWYPIDKK